MKVRFTSAACRELAEAAEFYETQQSGLGDRFLTEIEEAMTRIRKHPDLWAHVSPSVRRCLVHRFPFALFYHVTANEIQILAVADLRRDPSRWEHLL